MTNAAGQPTSQVWKLRSQSTGRDVTYTYAYDDNGNIISVSDGTNTTTYAYDSANQLIRENNQSLGQTWTWSYDNAGNITSRGFYDYTTGELGSGRYSWNYGYNDSTWGDLLTDWWGYSFENGETGNLKYAGGWAYTWEHGRQMASMSSSSETWTFSYDADGMRTGRTNGTKTYGYIYNGSSLSQMTVDGHTLDFTYDASGSPLSLTYDGTTYYYALNLQGDVVAILDGSGNTVVYYVYDAWGYERSCSGSLSGTLGYYNPLRYRGYVYDAEYKLYYLQSRYYDPGLGRFNAPDAYASTGQGILGNNMFAYCNNNPVPFLDTSGTYFQKAFTEICIGYSDKPIPCTLSEYIGRIAPPPQKTLNELLGHTHSTGIVVGSNMGGLTMGKNYTISNDYDGNFALQESDAFGTTVSTGFGGSIGLAHTITNAGNVQELNGEASNFGFTLCPGIGFSVDFVYFVTNSGDQKWGVTLAVVVGAEAEIHIGESNTYSTKSGRLIDLFN